MESRKRKEIQEERKVEKEPVDEYGDTTSFIAGFFTREDGLSYSEKCTLLEGYRFQIKKLKRMDDTPTESDTDTPFQPQSPARVTTPEVKVNSSKRLTETHKICKTLYGSLISGKTPESVTLLLKELHAEHKDLPIAEFNSLAWNKLGGATQLIRNLYWISYLESNKSSKYSEKNRCRAIGAQKKTRTKIIKMGLELLEFSEYCAKKHYPRSSTLPPIPLHIAEKLDIHNNLRTQPSFYSSLYTEAVHIPCDRWFNIQTITINEEQFVSIKARTFVQMNKVINEEIEKQRLASSASSSEPGFSAVNAMNQFGIRSGGSRSIPATLPSAPSMPSSSLRR